MGDGLGQGFPGEIQGLGKGTGFPDDGNKRGIAIPAGDHMAMKVTGNSGSAGTPDIEADVEAMGGDGPGEDILRIGDEVHHLEALIGFHVLNAGHFPERDNEQVAGIVRVAVEEDVVKGGAVDDEGLSVIAEFGKVTKGALDTHLRIIPGGDVVHSPVCVQYVHAGSWE